MRKIKKQKVILRKFKSLEPTISFLAGLSLVLVLGIIAFRLIASWHLFKGQKQGIIRPKASQEEKTHQVPTEKKYTVKRGDSLWTIAEHFYQSGYNWVDIARVNKLSQPGILRIGQVLVIPEVKPKLITVTPKTIATVKSIPLSQTRYQVEKGDSLSLIALRAYGDLFAWPKLWRANRQLITNPNIIYPGQKLTIPRP